MDLYVYYDVPAAGADDVRRRVLAMQAELARDVSRCRLLVREMPKAGVETWMEIYEAVPPGFENALAGASTRHAVVERVGPRHVERFVEPPR